ncbi:MAG: carbon-nitrogen hydrolase family protein [Firmicutes bacterium]|nr:carbon-nitrogen hydrolase family protein [Bacillota bacterium]
MARKVKVAAVQSGPVMPMDRKATTQKACRLIAEASRHGAQLIVFPECFIPAFPNWPVDPSAGWVENTAILTRESVVIPGPETEALGEAAIAAGACVCIGINERHPDFPAMIYNSLCFLGPDGKVIGRHRKLTPSHRERVFHGRGDGTDLFSVFPTPIGRIGGLICYEHLQPLFKYAMMTRGEEIHCAVWPGGWGPAGSGGSGQNQQITQIASRQYALESGAFTVVASTYLPFPSRETGGGGGGAGGAKAVETEAGDQDTAWKPQGGGGWYTGGSAVIAPDGSYIAGPVYGEETILHAEIDLDQIIKRKAYFDPVGRDARWDIVRLYCNPAPLGPCLEERDGPKGETVDTCRGGML